MFIITDKETLKSRDNGGEVVGIMKDKEVKSEETESSHILGGVIKYT